jgi:hypothetical protein
MQKNMPKKILTRKERDKLWNKKSKKEKTINGVEYKFPVKKIGNDIFGLADIFPIHEWSSLDELMDDLKDRYKHKKEIYSKKLNFKYRLEKKKYHVEVWRTYR